MLPPTTMKSNFASMVVAAVVVVVDLPSLSFRRVI
jgi:hypothetical protein